jgi:hypothetical protein
MIESIIADMETSFRKGVFTERTCFFFNVDETKITVTVDAQSYSVELGATAGPFDCSCKTAGEMFARIWNDGYRPGIMDFLGGAIKCDAPLLLPQFLRAFGK